MCGPFSAVEHLSSGDSKPGDESPAGQPPSVGGRSEYRRNARRGVKTGRELTEKQAATLERVWMKCCGREARAA
jgi:hypothetical protein